jgi:hypothetical protein
MNMAPYGKGKKALHGFRLIHDRYTTACAVKQMEQAVIASGDVTGEQFDASVDKKMIMPFKALWR